MGLDENAWEAFSRGTAIRRAQRDGLLRNVAVTLGVTEGAPEGSLRSNLRSHWGSEEAVAVLVEALADEEPLVRGHAPWALGRIGAEERCAVLKGRQAVEEDACEREEITRAQEDAASSR